MVLEKLTPIDQVELKQMKSSNPHRWPTPRIDDLIVWSKSMPQFRSIFLNMGHMEWLRIKDTAQNGADLPAKAGKLVPTQILSPGELGFHGCKGDVAHHIMSRITRQPQAGYVPDWKAFYVASAPGHALGYIEPPENPKQDATGVILSVKSRFPLKRIFISNAVVDHNLTSPTKAAKIKELLDIPPNAVLMDELGKRSSFLEMTDSPGNFERIIPWSLAEQCVAESSNIPVLYEKSSMQFKLELS